MRAAAACRTLAAVACLTWVLSGWRLCCAFRSQFVPSVGTSWTGTAAPHLRPTHAPPTRVQLPSRKPFRCCALPSITKVGGDLKDSLANVTWLFALLRSAFYPQGGLRGGGLKDSLANATRFVR